MAIVVTPSYTSPAVVGQPQSDNVVASGGTAPYSYAISSGSLPPGLVLNGATGDFSGTPTTDGFYTVTIQATDSSGPPHATGSVTFSILVVSNQSRPSITSFLGKGQAEPCLSGGRRFLTATFNPGRLPGWTNVNGSAFYPNAIVDLAWTSTEWNLLDAIPGQRNIDTYESLIISWNHTRGGDDTDLACMVDPGNGLPVYFGGNNGGEGDCLMMAVPLLSNSNLIKIAFQITGGGFFLLPADIGLLTLAVTNWKVKPFAYYTWGGFF